jgi:broad specificity phosphatase PhoE
LTIYLLRHGETEFNREDRLQGWCDSPLTKLGLAQAERMGERLKDVIGDPAGWRIVSSPLGRAAHSARIVAAVLGLGEVAMDERLREVSMGSWDGMTSEDIAFVSPEASSGYDRYDMFFGSPDGERLEGFAARLKAWLDETLADGRPVIAVSHGVAGRVIRGLYLGLAFEGFARLPAPQDAFFRLAEGRVERMDCTPVALDSYGAP